MSLKLPQYITTTERTVSVVGYISKNNKGKEKGVFQDNKGYIDDDGQIWIYSGLGKPKNKDEYPYFWINKDSTKEFSNPNELIKKAFSIERLKDMSLVNIVNTTEPNEILFNEEEINDIISSSAFYTPTIKDSDDFLKKIVKNLIIQKGIDINRLKVKTDEKYILPNMKAALNNDTKMSVVYFMNWMELLGCNFDITVFDSGADKIDPLKQSIVYESNYNRVSKLDNGVLVDLNTDRRIADETSEEE